MKTVADVSVTSRFLQGRGPGTPVVITAAVAPNLGILRDGDSVQAALSSGALEAATYASTAGSITGAVATVTINGAAGALADVVRYGDVVSVMVTVSDDAGTIRDFAAGSRIVAGIVPTITASDSLSARTLTVSVDGTTGVPAPVTVLTALTLDGVDVAADITGADPWTLAVPSSADDRTVAWTLTTTNAAGSDTASGAENVAADLFAPVSLTAPGITGTAAPGSTVTITPGTYSGTPAPVLTGMLTLDGVDVTAQLSGLDYEIPGSAMPGVVLAYSETAANGVAPGAQQAASVTVVAARTALLDTYPGAAGAWSLRNLSSGTTVVVRVRRGSDDAQANFTADDVAGGALAAWVGTGNDGFVATLFDQSGQAQHVTQDIASAQPVIVRDGLMVVENGASALDFTGGRYLSRGSGNSLDYSGNFLNVFSVNRHDGTGSTDRLLSDDKVGVQGYFLLRPKFSTTMTINDGTGYKFGGAPLAYTGQTVLTLLFDGSSGEGRFFLKGAVQDVFTTAPWAGGIGSSGEAGFAIGSGADGGQTWAGTQQELIVFTTDQSANRGGIEQNIADHYGITL